MSPGIPLTHVKRNLILICPCQQRLPLPMSRETSLCSAYVHRDSPYPCQEKPHPALPMSTETPNTPVKKNLTLLCPCQQRPPLPMPREALLCSNQCQGKPHSALPKSTETPLPISTETETQESISREQRPHSALPMSTNNITETPLTHVNENRDLLCSAYVNQ